MRWPYPELPSLMIDAASSALCEHAELYTADCMQKFACRGAILKAEEQKHKRACLDTVALAST